MKLVDKYKLTRKVAKLEKLYIEDTSERENELSAKTAKSANIFSKNLANVKAAVEAGQDVNQTNDDGLTPLAAACKSKVMMDDIVEYLLDNGANANDFVHSQRKTVIFVALDKGDLKSVASLAKHGANLNVHYKGTPLVEYALKDCGIKDADFLVDLVYNDLSHFDRIRTLRYITENRSKISGDVDALISKLADIGDKLECARTFYNNSILVEDLRTGNGVIFDKIVSCGYLPFIEAKYISSFSKSAINKMYKAIEQARDGKLDYGYITELRWLIEMCEKVCTILNAPSIAYDLINVNFINTTNHNAVSNVIWYLIVNNKLEKIKELAKGNLERSDYAAKETIRCLIYENSDHVDRDRTVAVCRLLNKFMGSRPVKLMSIEINDLQESRDKVFLDYLFDRGMGIILTEEKYTSRPSKEFIDVCEEHGFEFKGHGTRRNRRDYKPRVIDIVNAIDRDIWNSDLETFVNKEPQILLSDEVQAALNDESNRGSVTRRQLLRKIDQLQAGVADVYDM